VSLFPQRPTQRRRGRYLKNPLDTMRVIVYILIMKEIFRSDIVMAREIACMSIEGFKDKEDQDGKSNL
jgi:endo-1,4-beta-D-glucanase Y